MKLKYRSRILGVLAIVSVCILILYALIVTNDSAVLLKINLENQTQQPLENAGVLVQTENFKRSLGNITPNSSKDDTIRITELTDSDGSISLQFLYRGVKSTYVIVGYYTGGYHGGITVRVKENDGVLVVEKRIDEVRNLVNNGESVGVWQKLTIEEDVQN